MIYKNASCSILRAIFSNSLRHISADTTPPMPLQQFYCMLYACEKDTPRWYLPKPAMGHTHLWDFAFPHQNLNIREVIWNCDKPVQKYPNAWLIRS